MTSPLILTPQQRLSGRRFQIALFCFILLLIAYCDRVNLATAVPEIMSQYRWGSIRMGWVLSAFFLGYTCCLIPAGLLIQRFGPWPLLAFCITGWSIATACTPLARSLPGFYCMRFLVGVCESAVFPSINSLLAEWFPPREYARAAGFCWSGGYAGPIIAFPLAGVVMAMLGWKAIFYLFALLGVVLLLLVLYVGGTPRKWRLPAKRGNSPGLVSAQLWKGVLACPAVWALLILHFSSNWFAYVLLSWLPAYFQQARHFSVTVTAFASALPFCAALAGTSIFAWLADTASVRRSRTLVRKRLLLLYLLCAPALLLLPRINHAVLVVAMLSLSACLMTAATPVYASGSLDLAPGLTAMIVGIQGSFANLAGVLAPAASGYLMKLFSWDAVFAVTAGVCTIGAAAYLAFGSAEPQRLDGQDQLQC
jgi:ACS family sodium-dependent inorganic phosphate cotransporter